MGIFTVIAGLVGFVCGIIILIAAFQDSVWKGLISLFCGLYMIYYALVEFQHENKWLIVVLWIVCGSYAGFLLRGSNHSFVFH